MWLEYQNFKKIAGSPRRSKDQVNRAFEADCEIIKTKRGFEGCSIDSVAEEIACGLYSTPETWGWIAVMTSVSDLAAAALHPTGILLSCQWAPTVDIATKQVFFKSVNRALTRSQTVLLGGDSGFSSSTSMTSSIFGWSVSKPLTRLGAKPGDAIVLARTHELGVGPMLGLSWLFGETDLARNLEVRFRPSPKWKLIEKIRPYVTASIDTSDGITTSVGILSRLNEVGAEIYAEDSLIAPLAKKAAHLLNLPDLTPLLGAHGDFHTMLIVPEVHLKKVLSLSPDLILLGRIRKKKEGLDFVSKKGRVPMLAREIMDLPQDPDDLKKAAEPIINFYLKAQEC